MQTNYSLHKILSTSAFSFNANDYSRFKFGDELVAEQFGTDLALGFIEEHLKVNHITNQIVVFSSPYAFIPTATNAMKNYFVYALNQWLVEKNLPVIQEAKIYRTITYKEDYGALNAEERIKLIGNDSFYIDKVFLENKTLIFLDDIKITGSHERMIMKTIDEYGLTNDIYLLYFAELINKSIHPNIENILNFQAVKSIFDLVHIINSTRFAINTRIVKYILNSDSKLFTIFIQNCDICFMNILYNMALGNNYHMIETYQGNLSIIKCQLQIFQQIHTPSIE